MFSLAFKLLAMTIGFAYPAYCSIKALESSDQDDKSRWLVYWVVFAFFSVIEHFADSTVSWLPFYWLAKCLFLGWCLAPIESNGAAVIYSKVILPLFHKHEGDIDQVLAKAQDKAGSYMGRFTEKAKDMAAEHQLNKNKARARKN